MIKEKDLTIRIEFELKEKIKEKAKQLGLSTSAYVRMIIKKEIENE
jgi:antitoxin component of RelBE/YafQ-DinJ toxin-antitoxin module